MTNDSIKNNLILDLDTFSLGGYNLGGQKNKDVTKKGDGYGIYGTGKEVANIFTCFNDGYNDFSAFKGIVRYRGQEYFFDKNTTYQQVLSLLGIPSNEWNDGVEMAALFEVEDKEIEVSWNIDGASSLDYISLSIN
uniref:Uncharacterized protein n=1 Tax=Shewanella sp. (strain MR-7) TaxID=60481 RepID=Q0HPT1_SHESR